MEERNAKNPPKFLTYGELKGKVNMCCMENETEKIIVNANGALRAALMEIGDELIDLMQEFENEEIKIKVFRNYENEIGDIKLKIKVDGWKVLEITANDFTPYFGD